MGAPQELWTRDEEIKLHELWRKHTTIKVIAHRMGRSERSIRSKRQRMHLPPRQGLGQARETVGLKLDWHVLERLRKEAHQNGMRVSVYIRHLLGIELNNADRARAA